MPRVDNPNSVAESLPGQVAQLKAALRDLAANATQSPNSLAIGSGGLAVAGPTVLSGATTLSGGVAGNVAASGAVSGASVTASGAVSGATVSSSGDVSAGGNVVTGASGSLFSTYGRATSVVTSYVSAWFNGDGRLGATASSFRVKQDIVPADMSKLVEALRVVALVRFRRIEAVEKYGDDAPVEVGGIAEYFQAVGLGEYVFLDGDGNAQGINYELLTIPLIAAFQSIDARLSAAGL